MFVGIWIVVFIRKMRSPNDDTFFSAGIKETENGIRKIRIIEKTAEYIRELGKICDFHRFMDRSFFRYSDKTDKTAFRNPYRFYFFLVCSM